jgi:hypothetical protein
MGRSRITEELKKMKLSVSLSLEPETVKTLKKNCVNISALVNKLLKEYIESGTINHL